MRAVEREEEAAAGRTPGKLTLHLCIINMVIGTLYCSKVGGAGCWFVCVWGGGGERCRWVGVLGCKSGQG
jgi:hypothetical protein